MCDGQQRRGEGGGGSSFSSISTSPFNNWRPRIRLTFIKTIKDLVNLKKKENKKDVSVHLKQRLVCSTARERLLKVTICWENQHDVSKSTAGRAQRRHSSIITRLHSSPTNPQQRAWVHLWTVRQHMKQNPIKYKLTHTDTFIFISQESGPCPSCSHWLWFRSSTSSMCPDSHKEFSVFSCVEAESHGELQGYFCFLCKNEIKQPVNPLKCFICSDNQ